MTARKLIVILVAVIITAAFVAVYMFYDPSQSSLFPKCAFKALTGLDCPGCGSQRAIHAILTGDIAAAFRYNALMVCSIPLIVVYGIVEIYRNRFPRLYARLSSPAVIWTIFGIVIAWWLLRNLS